MFHWLIVKCTESCIHTYHWKKFHCFIETALLLLSCLIKPIVCINTLLFSTNYSVWFIYETRLSTLFKKQVDKLLSDAWRGRLNKSRRAPSPCYQEVETTTYGFSFKKGQEASQANQEEKGGFKLRKLGCLWRRNQWWYRRLHFLWRRVPGVDSQSVHWHESENISNSWQPWHSISMPLLS